MTRLRKSLELTSLEHLTKEVDMRGKRLRGKTSRRGHLKSQARTRAGLVLALRGYPLENSHFLSKTRLFSCFHRLSCYGYACNATKTYSFLYFDRKDVLRDIKQFFKPQEIDGELGNHRNEKVCQILEKLRNGKERRGSGSDVKSIESVLIEIDKRLFVIEKANRQEGTPSIYFDESKEKPFSQLSSAAGVMAAPSYEPVPPPERETQELAKNEPGGTCKIEERLCDAKDRVDAGDSIWNLFRQKTKPDTTIALSNKLEAREAAVIESSKTKVQDSSAAHEAVGERDPIIADAASQYPAISLKAMAALDEAMETRTRLAAMIYAVKTNFYMNYSSNQPYQLPYQGYIGPPVQPRYETNAGAMAYRAQHWNYQDPTYSNYQGTCYTQKPIDEQEIDNTTTQSPRDEPSEKVSKSCDPKTEEAATKVNYSAGLLSSTLTQSNSGYSGDAGVKLTLTQSEQMSEANSLEVQVDELEEKDELHYSAGIVHSWRAHHRGREGSPKSAAPRMVNRESLGSPTLVVKPKPIKVEALMTKQATYRIPPSDTPETTSPGILYLESQTKENDGTSLVNLDPGADDQGLHWADMEESTSVDESSQHPAPLSRRMLVDQKQNGSNDPYSPSPVEVHPIPCSSTVWKDKILNKGPKLFSLKSNYLKSFVKTKTKCCSPSSTSKMHTEVKARKKKLKGAFDFRYRKQYPLLGEEPVMRPGQSAGPADVRDTRQLLAEHSKLKKLRKKFTGTSCKQDAKVCIDHEM